MEKEQSDSEGKMEEMISTMGSYMVGKLNKRIAVLGERLTEIQASSNKNKAEIEKKLTELIEVMKKVTEKTILQTSIQKELLDLMGAMGKLDTEIEGLLVKDGCK